MKRLTYFYGVSRSGRDFFPLRSRQTAVFFTVGSVQ